MVILRQLPNQLDFPEIQSQLLPPITLSYTIVLIWEKIKADFLSRSVKSPSNSVVGEMQMFTDSPSKDNMVFNSFESLSQSPGVCDL